jgi:LPXTG-motif cell wall-anchored protein
MTVSAGTGGGSVVGVVLGGGAASGGGAGGLLGELPHTGAGYLMTLVAIAIFLLVAGFLMTGMGRRRHELRPAGVPGDHSTQG